MAEDGDNLPAKNAKQSDGSVKKSEKEWVADVKMGASAALKGVLGVVPGGSFIAEAINGVEARAQRRQMQALERTIELLKEDVSAIGAKLQGDDELADLWARGLNAARTAKMHAKVEAFAWILAGAVDADHNQRITYNALVKVLEDLDEEHLQTMLAIEEEGAKPPPTDDKGNPELPGARVPAVEDTLPHLRPIMGLLINALLSLQLIHNAYDNTYGGMQGMRAYILTDLGTRLLGILRSGERMPPPEKQAD